MWLNYLYTSDNMQGIYITVYTTKCPFDHGHGQNHDSSPYHPYYVYAVYVTYDHYCLYRRLCRVCDLCDDVYGLFCLSF